MCSTNCYSALWALELSVRLVAEYRTWCMSGPYWVVTVAHVLIVTYILVMVELKTASPSALLSLMWT